MLSGESRSTISAVCWVPRGKSKENPASYLLVEQDLSTLKNQLLSKKQKKRKKKTLSLETSTKKKGHASDDDEWSDEDEDEEEEEEEQEKEKEKEQEGEEDVDMMAEDEDEDEDDVSGTQFFGVLKEDGVCTLQDPLLKGGEEDSDEEEANVILPTDLILIAATAEQDFSSLEVYVYDEDRGSFYVHHDILTGGFPLCLEWINTIPSSSSSEGSKNLVASGSFDPEISIWDLDVLDRVDAVCTLGKKSKKKTRSALNATKKKMKKKKKSLSSSQSNADMTAATAEDGGGGGGQEGGEEEGHEGPVMCLHASPIKPQILASGSADDTVKLWDLTTARCLYTYRHHTNKVQSIRWHPVEEAVLLSASFDRRAAVIDVRTAGKSAMHAPLRADAEVCVWDRHHPMNFWVSSEDGNICGMDVRKMSSSSSSSSSSCLLWSFKAHEGPASGLCDSGIEDLMVTCGIDGKAKLWSVSGRKGACQSFSSSSSSSPSLVFERDLKGGPLYCCQSNMDLPNVIGFGGNCVVLWDITDTDVVKTAFGLKS